MRRARVDLRLPEAQKAEWQAASVKYGLDLSELIREGTDQYIQTLKPQKPKKSKIPA